MDENITLKKEEQQEIQSSAMKTEIPGAAAPQELSREEKREQAKKRHVEKRKKELLNELVTRSSEGHLSGIRKKLETTVEEAKHERKNYIGNMSAEGDYAKEYGSIYQETKNAYKRKRAINNPKSRLYAKGRNKEKIESAVKSAEKITQGFENAVLSNKLLGNPNKIPENVMEERKAFMTAFSTFTLANGNENNYGTWSKHMISYLGLDNDLKYLDGVNKEDMMFRRRQEALDACTDAILNEDLYKLDLSSDTAIAKKAVTFELMKKKVDAYQTLLKIDPSYFKTRGKKVKTSVEEKMRKMKLVCDYYDIRCEIMNDPYYATHYNSELSMQAGTVNRTAEPEKFELSKKLLKSYYIGLALSDEHVGGFAGMTEIGAFKDQSSQMIRNEIKQEVKAKTAKTMKFDLGLVRAEAMSNGKFKTGIRETRKKRHAHKPTLQEYAANVHNIADEVKRQSEGKMTAREKILSRNRFETIKEEENESEK